MIKKAKNKGKRLYCRKKMGSKFCQKNIFESVFDSFEIDDGFLMKIESDLKKSKVSEKRISKATSQQNSVHGEKEKKLEVKAQFNLPSFIDDLNESDFLDLSNKKNKLESLEVTKGRKNDKTKKAFLSNNFTSCLSPAEDEKSKSKMNLSSSTPIKPNDSSDYKESEEISARNLDYAYLEDDLFDEWILNDSNMQESSQKSTITFSQALKLIEEAESEREEDQKESFNHSVDLLTGEIVSAEVGNMFDESFGQPESLNKKHKNSESSSSSVVILDNSNVSRKSPAAQKLNFETERVNHLDSFSEKENYFKNISFNSDEDFDFLTQDLIENGKSASKCAKSISKVQECLKNDSTSPSNKSSDLNESDDDIKPFNKKQTKCFNVIESDSSEGNSSPNLWRKTKKKIKHQRSFQINLGRQFIESEAEVSNETEESSDEIEEDGEYDKSFVDEESYFTQNCSANMTSKYLESVKGISGPGKFKIPSAKPYNPVDVFSQIPEDNNTDYEIDSFCVNDVEEEIKTDLSDLEVAEKILEMERKKRRKKRTLKLQKLKGI